ncbi:hypothetical protein RF11_09666 [Thelohanellus kitauei]|uniref:Kelch domain-containing protein 10 n=1 Tax=Thelohanellus kitauei TaxID=669202 RepID=A0A0C2J1T6_THEKT|nr:hypothetical protein RF11_09666 [Thelohanellus kitauei]
MYDSCILYHNECLYIVGGFTDGHFLDKMFKFCLKTSRWTLVPQNGPTLSSMKRIFPTWTTRQTNSKDRQFPLDSNYVSFAFSSTFGYLSCGENLFGSSHQIWKIDLESLEWFKLDYVSKCFISFLTSGIFMHKMAVVADSTLYVFNVGCHIPFCSFRLVRFAVQSPALYGLCLETIARSPNVRSIAESLPASIVDELNINSTD